MFNKLCILDNNISGEAAEYQVKLITFRWLAKLSGVTLAQLGIVGTGLMPYFPAYTADSNRPSNWSFYLHYLQALYCHFQERLGTLRWHTTLRNTARPSRLNLSARRRPLEFDSPPSVCMNKPKTYILMSLSNTRSW